MNARFVSLTILLSIALAAAPAGAGATPHKHAIIVGISEYPDLPDATFSGRGPRNSALMWRDVLTKNGFDDIQMLTDSLSPDLPDPVVGDVLNRGVKVLIPGNKSPTYANVETALKGLESKLAASQGSKNDDVVIALIGHGTSQPARPGDIDEPDGLDEVFLLRDTTIAPDRKHYQNALVDNEIADHLKKLTGAAGHVWFVFDQCHAGSMTFAQRSHYLLVAPGSTSLIRADQALASKSGNGLFGTKSAPDKTMFSKTDLSSAGPAMIGKPKNDPKWPANYVAFYAVPSTDEAQTTNMPPGPLKPVMREDDPEFTALSYFVGAELTRNPKADFKSIIGAVNRGYAGIDKLKGLKALTEGDEVALKRPALE